MSEVLSKIVSIFIAAILMFIIPLLLMFEQISHINQIYVTTKTIDYIDSICNMGYISKEMYEEFCTSLAATGEIYNINMRHTFSTDEYEYYNEHILDEIYKNGIYSMQKKDYIGITIFSNKRSFYHGFKSFFFMNNNHLNTIILTYGGRIRDEIK